MISKELTKPRKNKDLLEEVGKMIPYIENKLNQIREKERIRLGNIIKHWPDC